MKEPFILSSFFFDIIIYMQNEPERPQRDGCGGNGGFGTTSYPSEEVKEKIEGIRRNDPECDVVYLEGDHLTDSHVKEIAIGLCSTHQGGYGNDNLVGLYLHCNKISDEGARALGHALGEGGNTTLQRLLLPNNNISDEGVRALGYALGEGGNTTLEMLDLNKNNISDEGARALGYE